MIQEYEQQLEEAIAQARIYSGEWTNMNPSEPGITILENLMALSLLQKEEAGQVTDKARLAILALAGYEPREARPARLLAKLMGEGPVSFPARQKFYAGDICFETEEEIYGLQGALQAIYLRKDSKYRELSNAYPFGKKPKDGDSIYLLLTELPQGEPTVVRMYIEVRNQKKRNPFSKEDPIEFAKLQWSALTPQGYEEIPFQDETHGFLQSGEIWLEADKRKMKKEYAGDKEGYLFQLRIIQAEYDCPPEIQNIHGPLIPLIQRDTMSYTQWYAGGETIEIASVFSEEIYLEVYVREEGTKNYVKYLEGAKDRFFEKKVLPDGRIRIQLQERPYRRGPLIRKKSVAVVCCDRRMMLCRELGILSGEAGQSFDCRMAGEAGQNFLRIGARHADQKGGERYQFFDPGEEEGICYTYEEPGYIHIWQAEGYIGWEIFLVDFATCVWDKGNIRPGNRLVSSGGNKEIQISNPVGGRYGRRKETLEDVQKRFVRDLRHPASAVTAADYETLAQQVPGLCICKASAYYDEIESETCVTIMPSGNDELPRLSTLYRWQIKSYLEKYKLLNGKVKIRDPQYIKVDVEALIHVRDRGRWNVKEAREAIREELDDRRNARKIGQMLSFERLTGRICSCPGVGHILELKISLEGIRNVRPGADIAIPHCAALYPGEIVIREEW